MPLLSSTYRIQFNLNFRFVDAEELVPYLHALGITHLYASPRFRARKGSLHGYDVADAARVNSELGTEEEFQRLVTRLHNYDMGLLLDIVPNHMAASEENPWWMDLLENGQKSEFASYFDIDWEADRLHRSRILLPVLGDIYGNVLESQGLTLHYDDQGLSVRYSQMRFPIRPESYPHILEACVGHMRQSSECEALHGAREICSELAASTRQPSNSGPERTARITKLKNELWELYRDSGIFQSALDHTLRLFNGIKGVRRSFDRLDKLLSEQAYRLAYWRQASHEINYRRFFDINELVGIRTDNPKVFDARHAPVFRLIKEGAVDALRVDHVDGLRDPLGYLSKLRAGWEAIAATQKRHQRPYILVEKIISGTEQLPEWPVAGTTGYDFINATNLLLVDPAGYRYLQKLYRRVMDTASSFADTWYECKKQVIDQLFEGEIRSLAKRLARLALMDRRACDIPAAELEIALIKITASLPVYRTYVRTERVSKRDLLQLERAVHAAHTRCRETGIGKEVFFFFRRLFRGEPDTVACSWRGEWLEFMLRWQMFTGAVMAKGFEDTAFYRNTALLSLNEVGACPFRDDDVFGTGSFHSFNRERRRLWPHTLNASSTHDTKRSEDVRARLHVLSEIPREWHTHFRRWSSWNRGNKITEEGRTIPSGAEELLIYQTLLAAWPLQESDIDRFQDRVLSFVTKAAREAKQFTSWLAPNDAHERALRQFVSRILNPSLSRRFLADFRRFQGRVAFHGAVNSLSQVLLKIASPGNPDFYQGCELWDFSLTDPDNRRPVDFHARTAILESLRRAPITDVQLASLLHSWTDGHVKLFLISRALEFRRTHRDLFVDGDYTPAHAKGSMREHVCAFLRKYKKEIIFVAIPRLTTALTGPGQFPLGASAWRRTSVTLPRHAPRNWTNILTGEHLSFASPSSTILFRDVFRLFPVALLYSENG
jgi:(1->4)-alpha-D-glucan 1-alpha-D-glucosylmutase